MRIANNSLQTEGLTLKRKIGYSVGQLSDSIGFNVFYFFFLFFLTDFAGVSPAIAGTISLIAVIWDAITDPIIGYLSDKSNSKYGRRRPFMIVSAIPYAICMVLMFTNVNLEPTVKSLYYIIVAMMFWTAYTGYVIPYFALGAELTQDYQERTSLRVWASVSIYIAVMIASATPLMIVSLTVQGGGSSTAGWRNVGLIFGILIFVTIFICWKLTKGGELPPEIVKAEREAERDKKENFFKAYVEIFKLKPVKLFGLSIFAWALVCSMSSSGMVYLMTNNLGYTEAKQSLFFTLLCIIAIIWLPIVNGSSTKFGKNKTYSWFMLVSGLLMCLFVILGFPNFAYLIFFAFAFQLGDTTFWTLYYSMMYDIAELDEFINFKRREGSISALLAFCQKLGAAVAMWMTGFILHLGGYDGMVEIQTAGALKSILYLNTLIPGAIGVVAGLAALAYPLTQKRFDALSNALAARREGKEYTTDGFHEVL